MQISDKAKELLKKNNKAMGLLVTALDKHQSTIERLIKEDHLLLTTPVAIEAIAKGTGLPEGEILIASFENAK